MQEAVKAFQEKFKTLKIESKDYYYIDSNTNDIKETTYYITGLNGNTSLQLAFEEPDEINEITEILDRKIFVFNDFLAIHYETTIEILLTPISFRSSLRNFDKEENNKVLEIGLNYHKNELNITLEVGEKEKIITKFSSFIRGGHRYSRRRQIVLKINNYTKPTSEGIENDTRNIINSVLFDIEYNYDIALETINIEGLLRRSTGRRRKQNEPPKEKINLVFKKYIPELIQYFHIAEKVDFIPFKFVCYYHIIEYFSDKSAYQLVSNEIKKLLLKPDFHLRTDQYVNAAINLFKKENDKFIGDKIKIERVLRQYINREELKEVLTDIELIQHFSNELILDCNKPLKLPAINFEQDGNFYSELTKRIYSVRCSIVHSNPDFDESKAVPFNPTPKNIEKLRVETELLLEIARKIIVDTKE